MFFSSKISKAHITAIKDIFNLKVVSKYEKYPGRPLMIRRKKTSFFNDVKLKVLNKIWNLQHKMFSSGGREVFIKVVAQAIPAYTISVFIFQGACVMTYKRL